MSIVQTGEQTQITPLVFQIAERIPGERVDYALGIAKHIRSMQVDTDSKGPDFSRTTEEILVDNKYNGCNDAGVVFASLLRAKGLDSWDIGLTNGFGDLYKLFEQKHQEMLEFL